VPLSKQILVQENDYVKAGTPLSDGAITPSDILAIKGPTKVQEYIVNEIQEVYRLQGVKINDKHFEIIVRQMMRKVEIVDPGDTKFLERQVVDKLEFMDENDWIYGKKVVVESGDSNTYRPGYDHFRQETEGRKFCAEAPRPESDRSKGCCSGNIKPGAPGYYQGCIADQELLLRCIVPGNNKGA
jgi:hypothetical protein